MEEKYSKTTVNFCREGYGRDGVRPSNQNGDTGEREKGP